MSRAQAIVLAGHGSQHHPRTAEPIHEHADRIRARGPFEEVRTAFWKEEPSLRQVASSLRCEEAYVVPVLTSEGYFADQVFPRELGVDGGAGSVELHYADAVGTHEAMTEVVLDRIESAIDGPPSAAGIALIGHGTDRHERSDRATREHARRIDALGRYASVCALFLDEAPHVGELYDRLEAPEIAVVPYFVADGHHTTRDIPEAIGHPGVGETAMIDGCRVHYAGAVGTEPRLADLILDRAVEAGARLYAGDASEPAGPAAGADAAFRSWLAETDGARHWGQLVIDHGPSGFEVRHRADASIDRDRLVLLDGTRALRARVRHDEGGRYRPLSGERSLPSGWILEGLDERGLHRAVRVVYPGSVADWFHGREGALAPTSFRDTAARQTGEYADLHDVNRAELAAVTAAVCGNCVRSRAWTFDGDGTRCVGGEDGDIPCREACPFFRSAALDLDDADGPVAEREDPAVPMVAFEEPGNRYRVRHATARTRQRRGSVPPLAGGDD